MPMVIGSAAALPEPTGTASRSANRIGCKSTVFRIASLSSVAAPILVAAAGGAQEKSRRGVHGGRSSRTECSLCLCLGESRALALRHVSLRGLHGDGGIAAIGVGADRVGERFVER